MSKILMSTKDSIKYKKDCKDFECLDDGTLTGDERYCKRSPLCQQTGIINGKVVNMLTSLLVVKDGITGEVIEHLPFCTGMYDLRVMEEKLFDTII